MTMHRPDDVLVGDGLKGVIEISVASSGGMRPRRFFRSAGDLWQGGFVGSPCHPFRRYDIDRDNPPPVRTRQSASPSSTASPSRGRHGSRCSTAAVPLRTAQTRFKVKPLTDAQGRRPNRLRGDRALGGDDMWRALLPAVLAA